MSGERILVLDDDARLAEVTARGLVRRGYSVHVATSGQAAIDMAAHTPIDLLLADVYLPESDGLDTASTIRACLPDLVVLVMTGEGTLALAVEAMRRGAQGFVVKPFTHAGLAIRIAEALAQSQLGRETMRLRLAAPMLEETIGVLAAAIDVRDPLTASHASRLPAMAALLASAAGLDTATVEAVKRGALLHDIGKIGVPDQILRKAGPLTPDEQRQMRRHPEIGATMLEHVRDLRTAVEVIRFHHEAWNGSGYPAGLVGDAIPIGARILAIVDAYDAMTSPRPYRPATSPDLACAELLRSAGSQFDPVLVDLFMRQHASHGPDSTHASRGESKAIVAEESCC